MFVLHAQILRPRAGSFVILCSILAVTCHLSVCLSIYNKERKGGQNYTNYGNTADIEDSYKYIGIPEVSRGLI